MECSLKWQDLNKICAISLMRRQIPIFDLFPGSFSLNWQKIARLGEAMSNFCAGRKPQMSFLSRMGLLALVAVTLPVPAMAEDVMSGGDTAWIITATALVLFMTLPGLALFYAGLVRSQAAVDL